MTGGVLLDPSRHPRRARGSRRTPHAAWDSRGRGAEGSSRDHGPRVRPSHPRGQ
jgi:hypothetical protein